MPQTSKPMDRHVFESMARQLGLEFELIGDFMHNKLKRDPDTIYLYETGVPIQFGNRDPTHAIDAIWYWKGVERAIRWDQFTEVSIRKILENNNTECSVCYQSDLDAIDCPRCRCRVCSICAFKMGRPEQTMASFSRGLIQSDFDCPECRYAWGINIDSDHGICSFMGERFSEFNDTQQKMLLSIKASSPEYDKQYAAWSKAMKDYKQTQLRSFRKGCVVKIVGLKSKANWNGKKARITGEKMLKNGAIRWPAKLLDRSKERALLKQCNMKKV